jgi:peptidoglycan/xylan/chitin deacetylase (PgdA/CDA1 family)
MPLSQQAKNTIKTIMGHSVRPAFLCKLLPRRGNIILMYHRVQPKTAVHNFHEPGLSISPETLAMHIQQISRAYTIVPLATLIEQMHALVGLCAITFDDGWIDTYETAFPVLKKHHVPATVFVPTNMIGRPGGFWFHDVADLAERSIREHRELHFLEIFKSMVPEWHAGELCPKTLWQLIALLKCQNAAMLNGMIASAYENLNIPLHDKRIIMDWTQMDEMSRHDIAFGPHGRNHFILPGLDRTTKQDEIFTPMDDFRQHNVPSAPIFSYPNGDWDQATVALVAEAGYAGAVTTRLGIQNCPMDRYLLPRIDLHEATSNTPALFWFRIFQAFTA